MRVSGSLRNLARCAFLFPGAEASPPSSRASPRHARQMCAPRTLAASDAHACALSRAVPPPSLPRPPSAKAIVHRRQRLHRCPIPPPRSHASPVDDGKSSTPHHPLLKVRGKGPPPSPSGSRGPCTCSSRCRNRFRSLPLRVHVNVEATRIPAPPAPWPPPVALHLLLLAPVERAPSSVQRVRLRRRGVNACRPKGRLDFIQIYSVSYTQRGSEFRWYSVLLAIFDIQDYFPFRPTRILMLHLLSGLLVHDFYDTTGLFITFSAAIPPYAVFKVGCIAFPLSGCIRAVDPKLGVSSEPCPDSPVALGAVASKVLRFPDATYAALSKAALCPQEAAVRPPFSGHLDVVEPNLGILSASH
ncbi:hypothetical protein DFH09DRAFT_1320621 [Mycena vulgaris]|nr:hypothetical protein DFH09DRAFT_1320621 [Mycena vulgaris]